MDFSKLAVHHSGKLVALPTIEICCYFSAPATDIAAQIGQVIDAYLDLVGRDKLKQYRAASGVLRNLTKRKLTKDLEILHDFPEDRRAAVMEYSSTMDATPGPFGLFVHISQDRLESFPLTANFLRLDFDTDFGTPEAADKFIDWYKTQLDVLPFQSSHAGYAFKRMWHSESQASRGVDSRIVRYFGFDPGYKNTREEMLGRTPGAHWLNALNGEMVKSLGGMKKISSQLQASKVHKLKDGILIQGAPVPPIGDINKMAPDIGSIPEIARLYKPLRTPITYFGGRLDAQEWLARYDDLDNRAWK